MKKFSFIVMMLMFLFMQNSLYAMTSGGGLIAASSVDTSVAVNILDGTWQYSYTVNNVSAWGELGGRLIRSICRIKL